MGKISEKDSTELVKNFYLEYAKYTLTSRAIPSILDGFKAGQRRLLYCASKLPEGKLVKSAKIVGDTLPYHPHSNDSLYGTLVGLTTPVNSFKQFDGSGNWGGPRDEAAAIRYTEAMLNEVARFCYTQFVDYADYEIGEADLNEPVALPALVPYSHIKGSTGVAVGLSTNIMPLNVMEVIDYCIAKLQGKSHPMPTPDLGDFIIDMDDKDMRAAVASYSGQISIKPRINQEGNKLVINDLSKGKGCKSIDAIVKALGDVIESGKVDFRDETTTVTRYVFEVADPSIDIQKLKNRISRLSSGTRSFNRVVVDENGRGVLCTFDYQIESMLAYLRKVLRRKIDSELKKFKHDEEVLLVIKYIKTSGLLEKIPSMSTKELRGVLSKQGFSTDSITTAIGKSITYLTKSHDSELRDIEDKIKKHTDLDLTDYMISLYREFKKVIRPVYNQYPHSIRRSKLLTKPHVRKVDDTHIEISNKNGYECSDGRIFLTYPDGSIEPYNVSIDSSAVIELDSPIAGIALGGYVASVTSDDGILVTQAERLSVKRDVVHLNEGTSVVESGPVYDVNGSLIYEHNGRKYEVSSALRSRFSYPEYGWMKNEIV